MNKIKKILLIAIFIIIIIIIAIIITIKGDNEMEVVDEDEFLLTEDEENSYVSDGIEDVKDISKFSIVENCIQQYYEILNDNSSALYLRNGEKLYTDEEINQMRLDYLAKEYIAENNININNINDYINVSDFQKTIIPLQMKQLIKNPIEKYLVHGYTVDSNYNFIEEFYIFVNLDTVNKTFSIEPITEEYNNIDEIKYENENISIEKNENNYYEESILNNEEIAKKYFSIYKKIVLSNSQLIYGYLDEEYRDKRFGSLENFEQYVQENKEEIVGSTIEGYTINSYEEYTEYTCQDQYNNIYTFDVSNPMKFSLKLDTYTIPTAEFKQTYDTADAQEKVVINTNKWILMINNQDYDNAYNVLSEEFRANYFPNKQDFINYIKENMYRYNKMEATNFETRGNTYLCTIQLTDLTEGEYVDETKGTGGSGYTFEWNIVMQLGNNYDFVMSFEVE